jgi:hypothetical protein
VKYRRRACVPTLLNSGEWFALFGIALTVMRVRREARERINSVCATIIVYPRDPHDDAARKGRTTPNVRR